MTERGSKLAIHANKITDELYAHVEQAAAQGTPFAVVKLTQEFTGLRAVKERSPQTTTVARAVAPHDGMQGVADISEEEVDAWADLVLVPLYEFAERNPDFQEYIDVWEFINEADPVGDRGYLMLGKVMRRCVQKAAADFPDLAWGVGSCNMGTPEYSEMQAFADSGVFEEENVVLCLHEGTRAPDEPINQWHSSESDHPDAGLIPGAPAVPAHGGALFGRVTYWRQILGDEKMPPVIITEAYMHAYGDVDEIRRRAAWVDDLYSRLWYVVAWMPFTHSPTGRWEGQDYTPAYPGLIADMATVADRENATRPEPDPDPDPEPVDWRRAVWEASLDEQQARGITLNPEHGLERLIFEREGYVPVHREITHRLPDGAVYGLMAAVHLGGTEPRIVLAFRRPWSGAANVEVLTEGDVPEPEPEPDILNFSSPIGTPEERERGELWH